ncbi:MAG: AI-2E family transporter [Rhodanobacter thiooxydans]|nr:AI-2E family transporter [Rhodanobacter thiooxydans]
MPPARSEPESLPEIVQAVAAVPRLRNGSRALIGLFWLAALGAVYFARALLMPIVLAVLFALLLAPLVTLLKKWRIHESIAAGVVVVMMVDSVAEAWVIPASFLAITAIEGQFIQPMFAGRMLSLNPVAVFISFLFWGWLWGIAGMLIAVPMLIIIKVVCSHVEHWEPIGTFLDRS